MLKTPTGVTSMMIQYALSTVICQTAVPTNVDGVLVSVLRGAIKTMMAYEKLNSLHLGVGEGCLKPPIVCHITLIYTQF